MTYDKLMTSLGETYEKLMKFIRFFVNHAPVLSSVNQREWHCIAYLC